MNEAEIFLMASGWICWLATFLLGLWFISMSFDSGCELGKQHGRKETRSESA